MKIQQPFHEGELEVQQRLGLRSKGQRNAAVIGDSIFKSGLGFIEQQRLLVLGSIDDEKNVWASVLTGQAGFVHATSERTLSVDLSKTAINETDPFWENSKSHHQIGMLFIDFASRRRLRVNGHIRHAGNQRLQLEVVETYPNCPKYIQRRQITRSRAAYPMATSQVLEGQALGGRQQQMIKQADTFFVASAHPDRGVDVSHRGGNPGFAQLINDCTLRIPDYQGNCLFNTLGNFVVNPRAGVVFVDFESGTTLQLIGRAEILWDQKDSYFETADETSDDTGGSNRFWQLHIDRWLQLENAHELEWLLLEYSPYNPQLNAQSTV